MSTDLGFRVLHRPSCPFCRRLRAYLAERDLEVDLVGYAPDTHHDELCRGNPKGQVPTCELPDGLVLFESSIIMEYLEDTQPARRLMPASAEARARARLLYDLSDHRLTALLKPVVRLAPDDPERVKAVEAFTALVADAERYLSEEGPFVEGAEMTFADLSVPPLVLRAMEAGLELADLPPRVRRWVEAVGARPTVRALFSAG
ncbi:MAG TPA: glutathione S-transferase family protein [Sandaracinaceae bacterium LLY-WYZ-13_1]|nr:glutathione S-transferase family protein [Sandaracinaceae bacterium LLY-WYZ-13_1]